jgi:undecaprenyl-diphosphatase
MSYFYVFILAVIQGAAELLPVSSSAHVIIAEKLMGLDPTTPEMTFLLVMLHTGTMFAVIVYFWSRWKALLQSGLAHRQNFIKALVLATVATGIVGFPLKKIIEKVMSSQGTVEIEALFGNLVLIGLSLFAVGVLILVAGLFDQKAHSSKPLTGWSALIIGAVQGVCLPFRGFSRSGATISTALLFKISKTSAEDFSFALAVILTPAVIGREALRLLRPLHPYDPPVHLAQLLTPGLVGMIFSFAAGLVALKLLSSLMEKGRWSYFAYYCFAVSLLCFFLSRST